MPTVAKVIIDAIAELGVTSVWGVVGDALNPLTDEIGRDDRLEWIGVRHEETGAFAASAQGQLSGGLAVCMGTVGPGSLHLLNGLYDAKKSRTPVLAICGQVPLAERGSNYFQEVDNDVVFADVAEFSQTITDPAQMPHVLEQAVNTALQRRGVAVITMPGDVGDMDMPKGSEAPVFAHTNPSTTADDDDLDRAAALLNESDKVTLLVGIGAREAREDVLAVAELLSAPMVLTIKAKDGFDHANRFQVGQSGLLGNPAAQQAFDECDGLLMIGTDFPYREWYPEGKNVVQIDVNATNIGHRTPVGVGLVGHSGPTLRALRSRLDPHTNTGHLDDAREKYDGWRARQARLTDPNFDREGLGKVRKAFDNPDHLIRPEVVAAAVDRHASSDAVFTCDTGMSTTWLARFVDIRDSRRLIGSFNLGSMANAMPQSLGISALDRTRQSIAFCGDGGLTMLLGDIITAVAYDLPVKLIVFDNSSLGMVKLEQEAGGLAEFGTVLANPDLAAVARACGLHAVRVEDPNEVDAAVREALSHDGPVLLDVVTNPEEISLPPKTTVSQAWGFAIAKVRETLRSAGDD